MKVQIILDDDKSTEVLRIENCLENDEFVFLRLFSKDQEEYKHNTVKVRIEDLKIALRKITAK